MSNRNAVSQYVSRTFGVGKVLQVVSTAKTDTFTTSSTSYTDITGLSVSITPSSASSKVLVLLNANIGNTNATGAKDVHIQLVRGATAIYIGDAAGSRTRATFGTQAAAAGIAQGSGVFLDSPATTSATTYKVQIRCQGDTAVVNRNGVDTDNANFPRTASSITVMEISA